MSYDTALAACFGFILGVLLGSPSGLWGMLVGGVGCSLLYVVLLPYANQEEDLNP